MKYQELLNTLKQSEKLSPNQFEHYSVDLLVDFLKKSHQRFFNTSIPKIEQNFIILIKHFEDNNSLKTLFNLFLKFQIEFKQHIAIEEKGLFPYIETLYKATRENSSLLPLLLVHYGKYSIKDFANSHENSECFLTGIIFSLQKQTELNYHPIFNILLKQICHLDNEIHTHSWIEDNILFNKVLEIENIVEKFITELKN